MRKSGMSRSRTRAPRVRAERVRPAGNAFYMPAAEAKNRFATVLEAVNRGRDVVITKHNTPKAVVLSIEKFDLLTAATTPSLEALTEDFNTRLAHMQTDRVRSAMKRAFSASPDALAKAAVKAARRLSDR